MLLSDVILVYKNHKQKPEVYTTFTGFCRKNNLKHNTLKAYSMPFEYFDKNTKTHYRIEKHDIIR